MWPSLPRRPLITHRLPPRAAGPFGPHALGVFSQILFSIWFAPSAHVTFSLSYYLHVGPQCQPLPPFLLPQRHLSPAAPSPFHAAPVSQLVMPVKHLTSHTMNPPFKPPHNPSPPSMALRPLSQPLPPLLGTTQAPIKYDHDPWSPPHLAPSL
jgi:hypothetical protein